MLIIALIIVCVIAVGVMSNSNNGQLSNNKLSFDNAFKARMGRDPTAYITSKLTSEADLGAIRYLFDIIEAEVEKKSKCKFPGFDFYYMKALKSRPVESVEETQPKLAAMQRPSVSRTPKHRWTIEEDSRG